MAKAACFRGKNSFYSAKDDFCEKEKRNCSIFASENKTRRCETFTSSFTYTKYIRNNIEKNEFSGEESSFFCLTSMCIV